MISSYFVQSSVARIIYGPHVKSRTLEIKPRVHTILCAKRCGKIYTIICFLGNGFLLGCNYSLANSLLHHEIKCLGWIELWWW